MATDDQQVLVTGTAAAPTHFTIPGNGQVEPKAIFAHFDGTAAATGFLAALKVVSDGGETVGIYPTAATIAAGGSADVSWFPGGGLGLGGSSAAAIGARITNNLGQTIPNDTWTTLAYEAVVYDTDGMANLGSNNTILTVNTGGLYMVVASNRWGANNAGKRVLAVTHNDFMTNNAIAEANYVFDERMPVWDRLTGLVDQPDTIQQVTSFWQASAGDFFATGAFQLSGAGVGTGLHGYTYFAATLLGT